MRLRGRNGGGGCGGGRAGLGGGGGVGDVVVRGNMVRETDGKWRIGIVRRSSASGAGNGGGGSAFADDEVAELVVDGHG